MTGEVVQTNSGAGSTTPLSPSWPTAPISGNRLLCIVNSDTVVTTPSGWTILTSLVSSQGAYVYQRTATGSGDTPSVAFSPTGSSTTWSLIEMDAAVVGVFDVSAVGTETSTANQLSKATTTITTTGASGDFLIAIILIHGRSAGPSPTAPSWNNSHTALLATTPNSVTSSNHTQQFIATRVQSPAGAVGATTCTWTNGADNAMAFALSYKLVGGAAAVLPSLVMAPRWN
jgi:hypothetical protein